MTKQVREFHAIGVTRIPGKSGFVAVRFRVSGERVLDAEIISPEERPEPKPFVAKRLVAECARLLQAASEEIP